MKMNIAKFVNVCLMASCLFLCLKECHSQLTFTPSWGGKRSAVPATQNMYNDAPNSITGQPSMNCNPKMDSMLLIYRMIQNEAQKMLECNSQTK